MDRPFLGDGEFCKSNWCQFKVIETLEWVKWQLGLLGQAFAVLHHTVGVE